MDIIKFSLGSLLSVPLSTHTVSRSKMLLRNMKKSPSTENERKDERDSELLVRLSVASLSNLGLYLSVNQIMEE
ncbi:hypothetical protein KIN20_007910 [Parelaphostrongylus tenuis]|uniref:Uncharacterized protein n=1 Tax=Parelaphostrongylus tenuis TaxID=148309 RepID=A0AAD5QJG5_PARTN|nr:hypothetical protein KIN20_007910 [Parelaphostrongylus tenuis]